MTRLPHLLFGRDVHASVHRILEELPLQAVGERTALPHTIFEELWHIDYWQRFLLTRARGETPSRVRGEPDWPAQSAPAGVEEWSGLLESVRLGLDEGAALAADAEVMDHRLEENVTVRGLLETLATHNSYHFGRIVALRQLQGLWPPDQGES